MVDMRSLYASTRYCVVATVDEQGKPWAAPVFYAYDNANRIYWWSDTAAQHSKNIQANSSAYLTFFDSAAAEGTAKGLYMQATADMVADDEVAAARALYNRFAQTFSLSEQNTEGDSPTRLYVATPEKCWTNTRSTRMGKHIDVREEIDL